MANVALSMGIGIGVNLLVGLLSPRKTETIEGSRLEELDVPKASLGSNIPIPLGINRYNACPIFWSPKIVEVRKETTTGGKGGPTQKTINYSYFGNFAALACGSRTRTGIEKITRIWLNGDLYWNEGTDITGQNRNLNQGSQDTQELRLSQHLEIYLGTNSQSPSPTIQSFEGSSVPAFRYRPYVVFRDLPLANFGNRIPKVDIEVVERIGLKVSQVVKYLCESVGLVENVDFSTRDLEIDIKGFSFKRSGDSVKSAIEELQQTFLFLGRDKGSKIEFFPFDKSASLLSVTDWQLGRSGQGNQLYKQSKTPDIDIPQRVEIKAKNILSNHDAMLKSAFKASKTHDNTLSLDTSIVTEPQPLADAAAKLLEYLWLKQEKFSDIFLPSLNVGSLNAGDRLTVLLENRAVEVFIQSAKIGANYELEIVEGIAWNADIQSFAAPPQSQNFTDDWELPDTSEPTIVALDLPLLRDSDSDVGVYVGANVSDGWNTGVLYGKRGTEEYEPISEIIYDVASGTVASPLPNRSPLIIDKFTKIVVQPDGESLKILSPCSESQLLAYKNLALIGSELVAFQDVVLLPDGRYELSQLIRGCRGTESAIAGHVANEKFYLVKDVSFQRVPGNPSDIGFDSIFAGVPEGGSILNITEETTITVTGESAKPYSPVNPVLTYNTTTGQGTLAWNRRTRRDGDWRDNVDVPLEEASEQYEVVQSGVSYFVSSPSWTYTGSSSLSNVTIYQLSSIVGRGKPLTIASIAASRFVA
jgi:hypothetical protein